jgi:hypothetical protein
MRQLLIFLTIVFTFFACNSGQECEHVVDLSKINTDIKLIRLEKNLFEAKSPDDIHSLLNKYPLVARRYFGVMPNDTASIKVLFDSYTLSGLKEFYLEGEKINENFPELESSIKDLFLHVKYYFPSYKAPEVYTVVTGLPEPRQNEAYDLVFEDSLIVLGIDFFYGSKSKWRPRGEYNYMLQRREPYYIVPTLAMRLAQENFVEVYIKDKTMLEEMIRWGKAHYFVERMVPCAPDSIIIGYTSQQIVDVEKNMDLIWGHFIEKQLLYLKEKHEIQRYVGESPKVSVIGEKCPGRIGRYLGWQIVKTYMEKNPEITLQDLMKEKDALKIFKQSKYKPRAK